METTRSNKGALYVISTGREPELFPDLSTRLIEDSGHTEFRLLNAVILKACQPDCAQRYQSAAEMLLALQRAQENLARGQA